MYTFISITAISVLVGLLFLVLLTFAIYRISQYKKRKDTTPKDPFDKAVQFLSNSFVDLSTDFERMERSTFQAYAQSAISGVNMWIRNYYRFWEIYDARLNSKKLPADLSKESVILYDRICYVSGKPFMHPDSASAILSSAVYDQYWEKNRARCEGELQKFKKYQSGPFYRYPGYPFNVEIPDDLVYMDGSWRKKNTKQPIAD